MSNIRFLPRRWRKPLTELELLLAQRIEPRNKGFIADAIRRVNAARERERAAERERAREARRLARERVERIERKVSPMSEYRHIAGLERIPFRPKT
jgi:hypothetical protein